MTQTFQIGDIVRIEPVSDETCQLPHLDIYAGRCAYIRTLSAMDDGGVSALVVLCDETCEFQLSDTLEQDKHEIGWVPSHMTLIRESPLRTLHILKNAPESLIGQPIHIVGTCTSNDIVVDDGQTVRTDTRVSHVASTLRGVHIVYGPGIRDAKTLTILWDDIQQPCTTF